MSNMVELPLLIKIDKEEIARRVTEETISRTVSSFFNCDDLRPHVEEKFKGDRSSFYDEMERLKKERVAKLVKDVDWNKLPEEMQRSFLRGFIEKFIIPNTQGGRFGNY